MRITLFGASGKTGQVFLRHALQEGNEVTAFVRSAAKLNYFHPNLIVLEGDIHDAVAVSHAIEGADAVVSTLGLRLRGKKDVLESAAWTIIAGMRQHGVKRFVTLTNSAAHSADDDPKLIEKALRKALKWFVRPAFTDTTKHAQLVGLSDIEWTIVRAHLLTNGPHTGEYRVGFMGQPGAKLSVSRADISDFMLQELGTRDYIRRMPLISY